MLSFLTLIFKDKRVMELKDSRIKFLKNTFENLVNSRYLKVSDF